MHGRKAGKREYTPNDHKQGNTEAHTYTTKTRQGTPEGRWPFRADASAANMRRWFAGVHNRLGGTEGDKKATETCRGTSQRRQKSGVKCCGLVSCKQEDLTCIQPMGDTNASSPSLSLSLSAFRAIPPQRFRPPRLTSSRHECTSTQNCHTALAPGLSRPLYEPRYGHFFTAQQQCLMSTIHVKIVRDKRKLAASFVSSFLPLFLHNTVRQQCLMCLTCRQTSSRGSPAGSWPAVSRRTWRCRSPRGRRRCRTCWWGRVGAFLGPLGR